MVGKIYRITGSFTTIRKPTRCNMVNKKSVISGTIYELITGT